MKYYFGVIDCDSVTTAQHIYDQVDGSEIEKTSNFLDVRYIPDDISLANKTPRYIALWHHGYVTIPRDVATSVPINYKAPLYVTEALQMSNLECTWDADDYSRTRITMQNITNLTDINEAEYKDYIASSSESEDDTLTKEQLAFEITVPEQSDSSGGKDPKEKEKIRTKYQ